MLPQNGGFRRGFATVLGIVSGGPKGRREVLDDALAVLDAEGARAADETERILRQRAALRELNDRLNTLQKQIEALTGKKKE